MKKIASLMLILVMGCAGTNKGMQQITGVVDLDGVWVGNYNEDLQFVLLVNETPTQLGVKIMGRTVTPLDYKKRGNQAIMKFKNAKGDIYHLLAQVDRNDQMRVSITAETVTDFLPLGMLGETVYRLTKMEESAQVLSASLSKGPSFK